MLGMVLHSRHLPAKPKPAGKSTGLASLSPSVSNTAALKQLLHLAVGIVANISQAGWCVPLGPQDQLMGDRLIILLDSSNANDLMRNAANQYTISGTRHRCYICRCNRKPLIT
jgi:hypothetical protein